MALVMLALPGVVFVYNGEELGLPNVDLPDEVLQDPVWERSDRTERGRDGCRVPMPWSGDAPPFGFSTTSDTWLPMPAEWSSLTVERQQADPDSTLHFFRRALRLRTDRSGVDGAALTHLSAADGVLTFRTDGGLTCVLNAGEHPVDLPAGEVLLTSAALQGHSPSLRSPQPGRLPPDAAAWLV
jgi:alpha-glucosidase